VSRSAEHAVEAPLILMNDFRRQWEELRREVIAAVCDVGESGWYILGTEVSAFETALARDWGLKHAVGVGSGLDAIEISLRIAGCRPGDLVLTTPLSAFATTLAVVRTGAIPVFVDTDSRGLLDLGECERILEMRPDIRFLLPVHLYGHALDLQHLRRLSDRFGCIVIEDCAQAILASFEGKPVGSAGSLAAASFYPTKNLGAMGDAGAILTNREEFLPAARASRDYGQSRKYQHDHIGLNSRLDELHAAILRRAFLPRLAAWTARRRSIANRYLAGINHAHIRPIDAPPGSDSVWHLFPVLVGPGRKASFLRHLAERRIGFAEHYPILIPEQNALRNIPKEVAHPCPRAREIAGSEVSLPIHPYLTDTELEQVIDACNTWAG
jgi:dTDP-3-amino-3,4,6-trideoxy-alpha-D-glucose transaminase